MDSRGAGRIRERLGGKNGGDSRKIRRQGWPSSVALSRVGRYMSSPAIDFRQEATRPGAPTPFCGRSPPRYFLSIRVFFPRRNTHLEMLMEEKNAKA